MLPKTHIQKIQSHKNSHNNQRNQEKILRAAKKLAEEQGQFTMAQLLTEVAKKEKIDPLKALKALKDLVNQNLMQPVQQRLENGSHSNFE